MRTQEEIVARVKERKTEDFFGFEISDYVTRLTFENAQQFGAHIVNFILTVRKFVRKYQKRINLKGKNIFLSVVVVGIK